MFINNLFQSVFGQWSSNDQQTDINNNSTVFKWLTKEEESQIFSYADQKWKTYTEKKALVVDEYKRKLKEKYEIKRKQDRFEANTELEEKSLTSKDPVTSQTYKSIWRNWEVAESIRDYVTAWWKSEADDWKGVWNDDKWVIWLYISKNPEQSWAINEYINWNWEQYDFIQQMHWDRTPESKSVQEKEAREKELNSYNIQDIINWSTWTWVDYATMPYRLLTWPILWISEWSLNAARRIWNNIWDIWRIVKSDKSLAEKFNQILLWEVIWDSIWWGIWDFLAWGIEWSFKWFTTWEQRQALSNEVSWFIQNLMESDLGQDTLNWWNNLSEEQQQEAKDYLSYMDWYLNLIWLKWWKAAKPALEKWLNKVAWSLEDVGSDIGWAIKNYQVQNATKNLAENTAKANELAWRIVQWDIKAQWEAVNALKEIDTKWVKTYKDLWDRIWTKKKEIAEAVDKELAKDNTLYDGKTTRRVDMPDWSYQNLWQTPVHDAIKDLRELYSKLWDQEELLKLKYWEDKLNNEWLTKLEINNLAKQHGSEFSKKAFTEAWEPKWNDVWVKYETNRKAIKEYVRDLMPDDTTRNLDKMYHDLTDTEYYVKKMSEKVNTLTQKIKNRNLIEKFWAGLGDVINMVTWGWIKSFVTKFLPSNVWNKINNSLDMQRELPKLLEKLDNINKKIDLAKSKKDVKEIADDLKETLWNPSREWQINEVNNIKNIDNTNKIVNEDWTPFMKSNEWKIEDKLATVREKAYKNVDTVMEESKASWLEPWTAEYDKVVWEKLYNEFKDSFDDLLAEHMKNNPEKANLIDPDELRYLVNDNQRLPAWITHPIVKELAERQYKKVVSELMKSWKKNALVMWWWSWAWKWFVRKHYKLAENWFQDWRPADIIVDKVSWVEEANELVKKWFDVQQYWVIPRAENVVLNISQRAFELWRWLSIPKVWREAHLRFVDQFLNWRPNKWSVSPLELYANSLNWDWKYKLKLLWLRDKLVEVPWEWWFTKYVPEEWWKWAVEIPMSEWRKALEDYEKEIWVELSNDKIKKVVKEKFLDTWKIDKSKYNELVTWISWLLLLWLANLGVEKEEA